MYRKVIFCIFEKHEDECWKAYDYLQITFPDHFDDISQLNSHKIPMNDTQIPSRAYPVFWGS